MTFTMPEELIARIDDYNNETGVPKSTLVQMAVTQYLDGQKLMKSMPEFMTEMKKVMEMANYQKDIEEVKKEHQQMKDDGLLKD